MENRVKGTGTELSRPKESIPSRLPEVARIIFLIYYLLSSIGNELKGFVSFQSPFFNLQISDV